MKTRIGFVSNSSSSSFVVIDAKDGYDVLHSHTHSNLLEVGVVGEKEFGWGPEKLKDIYDRINFSYLQAIDLNKKEWFDMLEKVIKENSKIERISVIINNDYESSFLGYIDHQSSAREGCNTEMFESEQRLKDFIFGKGSFIKLDNDNH